MVFTGLCFGLVAGSLSAQDDFWKPYERLDFKTNITVTIDHDWDVNKIIEFGPRAPVEGLTAKIIQKSGTVCFRRGMQPGGSGNGKVNTIGIYELQGGTLILSNSVMRPSLGKATGIFRQTGGRSELRAGYIFDTKNDRSRLELLGGEMSVRSFCSSFANRGAVPLETWVLGNARLVFDGGPYFHVRYVSGGVMTPKLIELQGTPEICIPEGLELLIYAPIFGKGGIVKTGKGDLWLRRSDYRASDPIMVKEGTVNYVDEQLVPNPEGDFPVRIAQMHAKRHAKGSGCRGEDQFDVHFADAGWPVRACDKYPASWVGMARLAHTLDSYDVVTINTMWNHQLQGEQVDMTFFGSSCMTVGIRSRHNLI